MEVNTARPLCLGGGPMCTEELRRQTTRARTISILTSGPKVLLDWEIKTPISRLGVEGEILGPRRKDVSEQELRGERKKRVWEKQKRNAG